MTFAYAAREGTTLATAEAGITLGASADATYFEQASAGFTLGAVAGGGADPANDPPEVYPDPGGYHCPGTTFTVRVYDASDDNPDVTVTGVSLSDGQPGYNAHYSDTTSDGTPDPGVAVKTISWTQHTSTPTIWTLAITHSAIPPLNSSTTFDVGAFSSASGITHTGDGLTWVITPE